MKFDSVHIEECDLLEVAKCPHCGMSVALDDKRTCPSCSQRVPMDTAPSQPAIEVEPIEDSAEQELNPYAPLHPREPQADAKDLTTGEKLYCGSVLGFLALWSFGVLSFFVFTADPNDLFMIIAMAFTGVVLIGSLCVTTSIHLLQKSLFFIPMMIQCACLLISIYGIPLAIWGAILFLRRRRREKSQAQASV